MNTPKLQSVDSIVNPDHQEPIPDPYDLNNLRLTQSFVERAGVKKLLTTVPVRKPGPQEFFRVHPSPDYRADFPMIDLKEDDEQYLVVSQLVPELIGEIVSVTLFTVLARSNVLLLWPVRLPGPDGKDHAAWRSAREAAELAQSQWIRVKWNRALGAYDIYAAEGKLSEPDWPGEAFQGIIKIGFQGRLITSLDHQAIKNLRGQV
jgi:hypothetical protein